MNGYEHGTGNYPIFKNDCQPISRNNASIIIQHLKTHNIWIKDLIMFRYIYKLYTIKFVYTNIQTNWLVCIKISIIIFFNTNKINISTNEFIFYEW